MSNSTIVRIHQHAADAPKNEGPQAIGRSCGGLSTKVHTAVGALGNPLRLIPSAGLIVDIDHAANLIAGIPARVIIGDKGYDTHPYKDRNLIGRFFARIKQTRPIATRYDKLARREAGSS